jgi:hypothetical protein
MEPTRTDRLNEWRRLGRILPEDEDPEILAGVLVNQCVNHNYYSGASCEIFMEKEKV